MDKAGVWFSSRFPDSLQILERHDETWPTFTSAPTKASDTASTKTENCVFMIIIFHLLQTFGDVKQKLQKPTTVKQHVVIKIKPVCVESRGLFCYCCIGGEKFSFRLTCAPSFRTRTHWYLKLSQINNVGIFIRWKTTNKIIIQEHLSLCFSQKPIRFNTRAWFSFHIKRHKNHFYVHMNSKPKKGNWSFKNIHICANIGPETPSKKS